MKSHPYLVKEDFTPPWFEPGCLALFFFQGYELPLDVGWTFATLEQMRMDVLTRRVGGQTLGRHGKVFAQSCMAVAMTALESRVTHWTLGPGDEAISLGEVAALHLSHEKVDVWWDHGYILRVDNKVTVTKRLAFRWTFPEGGLRL